MIGCEVVVKLVGASMLCVVWEQRLSVDLNKGFHG